MIKRILYWALFSIAVISCVWFLFLLVYLLDNEMYIHAAIVEFVLLTIWFALSIEDEDISNPPF